MDFMKVFDQTVREMYVVFISRFFRFEVLVIRYCRMMHQSICFAFQCRKREVNLKVLKVPEIEQKVNC